MRRILVVVAAVSLLLAGCSDDGGGGDPGEGGRPAKVDGVPTGAGTHKQKLKVDAFGHREYLLHVRRRSPRASGRTAGPPSRPRSSSPCTAGWRT